jgi:hypothetical protein
MYGNSYRSNNSDGYNRRGSDPLQWAKRAGIPVTLTLLAANLVTFLVAFFTMQGRNPFAYLAFYTGSFPAFFWTPFTWPLVAPLDLIGLLFGGFLAYQIGGSIERSWSSRVYGLFLVATSVVTALTLYGGAKLLGVDAVARGLYLAMAAPTVAWCMINRREVVSFWFIPIPAPVLAGLTVALTWFTVSVGAGSPFLGIFALSGCALAYWYATQGRYKNSGYRQNTRPVSRPSRPGVGGATGFHPLRWWKERQERKRLEAIFRRSGFTDED